MTPPSVPELAVATVDFSPYALFLQADPVVKVVMIGLLCASVWSWAIILDKLFRLRQVDTRVNGFENKFWSGGSLEDLYDKIGSRPADPMAAIFVSAMREWRRAAGRSPASDTGIHARFAQRMERAMHITMARELGVLEKRVGFLASTGSVAPFVGLFGTVWGIMNSFHAIGLSNDTTLATVAPGIAEALFATALGLVAAIPAVVAYNKLSSDLDRFAQRLENFSGEFSAILLRQLDECD